MSRGTNSKEYVYANFWDSTERRQVIAEGELRRLSMDLDRGEAEFHLKQDGGKASFLLGCSRAEDLWTCPTLVNWSKQIVAAAFYNDALKDAFMFDFFAEGFPANDDGSISKVFGEPFHPLLIEAKPLETGSKISTDYKISATCLKLPSGRRDGAVSMPVTMIGWELFDSNWFSKVARVHMKEKQYYALTVYTEAAPKSRPITIDRADDGDVWTTCRP
eukprot:GHVS01073955.1.p1 GENE.GHVS01073955.1~~GHVS01073955.1.p1  ORF type:complete len:218 (+),score=9.85 GHVS01073955.1:739-1392(+)